MNRHATRQLEKWKNSPLRKPLLLLGARQVGKTWLMKEFGAQHFKRVAYIRFDQNERMRAAFERDYNIQRILESIQLEAGFKITPDDTLIILDEIQDCTSALTALKYFCEEAREYHIVAAGSLLGLQIHRGTGFPVGKVDIMQLHPMSFCEFLEANGHELYVDVLNRGGWQVITDFASSLEELLRLYYVIGGMPEAVQTYIDTRDFALVRRVHENLLSGYERDFSKHAPAAEVPRIAMIWNSIPEQLARENKKFVCKDVQPGLRMRNLECGIQWLMDAGLVSRISRITKPAFPPDAYRDGAFKLFFLDVGLLAAKVRLPVNVLLDGNRTFTEFKGALTEQYVLQQLLATGMQPYYWSASNSQAEIDFILQGGLDMVPLEVKAEQNLQSKSLKSFCKKFYTPKAVRLSMAPYREQDMPLEDDGRVCRLLNIPLYAAHLLPTLLA